MEEPGRLIWLFECCCGRTAEVDANAYKTRVEAVRQMFGRDWDFSKDGVEWCPDHRHHGVKSPEGRWQP